MLFTDPQPESLNEVGYIRDDVCLVGAVGGGVRHHHGDIMFDDLSYYPRYKRIVGTIGLPWFNCRGNHDMNLEAPDNTHRGRNVQAGVWCRWHAFQYGGATFILLDNVDYLGTDPSRPNGFGKYRGYFGERQLGFVRNVLANVPRDSLVVISFHIPLKTLAAADAANNTVDMKDFLAAIGTHPNTVSFCGHTHTNEHWYFGAADGYAADGQPGARIIITSWRQYPEAGGRARSMRAGSRWRCNRTARPTDFTFCRWTVWDTPRRWCRRMTQPVGRCGLCWTARCMAPTTK